MDAQLEALGVKTVAILRKRQPGAARRSVEAGEDFAELIKWRTGAEGRIAALKRHG